MPVPIPHREAAVGEDEEVAVGEDEEIAFGKDERKTI